MTVFLNFGYLISVCFFVLGLKLLSKPDSAKRGNYLSMFGMFLAVVITLTFNTIETFKIIAISLFIGSVIGIIASKKVKLTAMPELVALFNGAGGLSSFLVAYGSLLLVPDFSLASALLCFISVVVGCVTFSGSLVAWAKLSGVISSKPVFIFGQKIILCVLFFSLFAVSIYFCYGFSFFESILIITVISIILGILIVMAIGGGDMPVVIALLNSYSGIAASLAGLVVGNVLLVIVGILVGASGLILTNIMCKAMNRKLSNVIFGGFGSSSLNSSQNATSKVVNEVAIDEAYLMLEAARKVMIIPGYGLAVSQAQHVVRELGDLLNKNNCDVEYAIHPVAGRMPGHMNVLLAESNIDYGYLIELEDANEKMPSVDVAIVIGANDVVNPDSYENPDSQLYSMPIIDVVKAQTVIVLKRSMKPGFAGVENPLFYKDNTRMLFGDAKSSLTKIVQEFKS